MRRSTQRLACSSVATTATRLAIRSSRAFPDSLGGSFDVRPVKLPLFAISPDRRSDVILAERDALNEALTRAEAALARLEPTSRDAEKIELARVDVASARAKLTSQIAVSRAESLVDEGQKGTAEWTRAAQAATTAQRDLALVEARRAELTARRARRGAKPGQRAVVDKAHADTLKALGVAQQAVHQPAGTNYSRPPRTTYPATSTGRRLALARWITDRSNPLTARVAVNHLWGRHFGRAIVPSVNDFGRNGQRPSHPALLDWLAAEFMERGWSMKAIHRLIVTSATYRQDSKPARRGPCSRPGQHIPLAVDAPPCRGRGRA